MMSHFLLHPILFIADLNYICCHIYQDFIITTHYYIVFYYFNNS